MVGWAFPVQLVTLEAVRRRCLVPVGREEAQWYVSPVVVPADGLPVLRPIIYVEQGDQEAPHCRQIGIGHVVVPDGCEADAGQRLDEPLGFFRAQDRNPLAGHDHVN